MAPADEGGPAEEASKEAQPEAQPEDPKPALEDELPLSFEIPMRTGTNLEETVEIRIARLQREGQAAYLDGQFNEAIGLWTEWCELDPANPRPRMLVGDAFLRKDDTEQAIANYDRSLALNQGQISLVIRRVKLLTKVGRLNDAVESLNLYARLYPNEASILLAQAEWLWRQNRIAEAVQLVRRIIQLEPDNMEANAMALRMPLEPDEFDARLAAFVKLGEHPSRQNELGQAVWKYDLLGLPRTDSLMRLVRQISEQKTKGPDAGIFMRLNPRFEPVLESCAGGKLSEAWWMDGGMFNPKGEAGVLTADSSHSEPFLRLLGSEHIRDGFVEATVKKVNGSFWLYARRTADHFVRFGFDERQKLYLQVWRSGHTVASQIKPWTLPEAGARIRLETRGGGLIGLVDGVPVFPAPLDVPPDLSRGWIGVSVFQRARGTAQAVLSSISAGPLMSRLALLPPLKTAKEVDALLAQLQPEFNSISDLAPRWFRISQTGSWSATLEEDEQILRLVARYYHVRLLPTIEAPFAAALTGADLVKVAAQHDLDGFTVLLEKMPDPTWIEKMEQELADTSVTVLVMVLDPRKNRGQWRGIGQAAEVFNGAGGGQDVLLSPWFSADGTHAPVNVLPVRKAVVLVMPGALPEQPPVENVKSTSDAKPDETTPPAEKKDPVDTKGSADAKGIEAIEPKTR